MGETLRIRSLMTVIDGRTVTVDKGEELPSGISKKDIDKYRELGFLEGPGDDTTEDAAEVVQLGGLSDDDLRAQVGGVKVADIKSQVGEDAGLAARVLEAEKAQEKPRSTLVEHLESVVTAP